MSMMSSNTFRGSDPHGDHGDRWLDSKQRACMSEEAAACDALI
jgi:hypothetical protein